MMWRGPESLHESVLPEGLGLDKVDAGLGKGSKRIRRFNLIRILMNPSNGLELRS